ncbi:hypothetical protein [Streptomyces herbicida]|uniref:hypothetical protein n=1 Tax=Streptomyces herbicida TaxID=3065675 RepID=UPI002931CE49|nr:hypothetical protein [Streptomyces sp. NEAU-HV9]
MSYSLSVYKFVNGEPVRPDMNVVRDILSPYLAVPEELTGDDAQFWIRAVDGSEVEVDVVDCVIGVERPQTGKVWKIIIELANRAGGVILTPNGTFLCRENMREHLPEGMANDSVFVPEITLEAFERVAGPFRHPLS